ncbi:MAG: hypothetical protein ACF8PN_08120 [Phycisphaerales bacterium]
MGCKPDLRIANKDWAIRTGQPSGELLQESFLSIERWARKGGDQPLTWLMPTPEPRIYPGWPAPSGGVIGEAVITAVVAGSSDTTVDVLVNGFSQATVTLPASSTKATQALSVPFDAGDVVSLQVTGIGLGLDGLSVQLRVT